MRLVVVSLLLLPTWSNECFFGTAFLTTSHQDWIRRPGAPPQRPHRVVVVVGTNSNSANQNEANTNDDKNNIEESTIEPVDQDGSRRSSDMTDRFKYQVNALMGTYDPLYGVDDERQDGNILQAMLNFPVRYTFHVVGKTSGEASSQQYVDEIKNVILAISGDKDAQWEIRQRGAKFTKIKFEVEVHSTTMVNQIYTGISRVNGTVMRF